jgi:mannose-6-phosphate isomerase-like protein (cupin superfamily)
VTVDDIDSAPDPPPATNVDATAFRTIFNSSTGERIAFTDVHADILRLNWRSMPGGAITEHVHPHQHERFIISEGEAHFTVNRKTHVVGPGETLDVPAGVRHSESNQGSAEVVGVIELRPALRTKEMFEAFAGLAAEGKTTPRGAPKNPLQLGATVWHFRHESRATVPPIWLQNLILPPLSGLAKIFGVRAYHARWDSRTTTSQPPTGARSSGRGPSDRQALD